MRCTRRRPSASASTGTQMKRLSTVRLSPARPTTGSSTCSTWCVSAPGSPTGPRSSQSTPCRPLPAWPVPPPASPPWPVPPPQPRAWNSVTVNCRVWRGGGPARRPARFSVGWPCGTPAPTTTPPTPNRSRTRPVCPGIWPWSCWSSTRGRSPSPPVRGCVGRCRPRRTTGRGSRSMPGIWRPPWRR